MNDKELGSEPDGCCAPSSRVQETSGRHRRLVISCAMVIVALYFAQDRIRSWVHSRAEDALVKRDSVAVGGQKPKQSIEEIYDIGRLCDQISRTYVPGMPLPAKLAAQVEEYLQPVHPVETRMRAMKFGQVIGQERFRKYLIAGFQDPDPRVRRTALAKADTDLGLWPQMLPRRLDDDPDPQVRAAWKVWLSTVDFRRRTGRDPSTGRNVSPPPR